MIRAVYPGSFDPFTLGHLDILKRGCVLFDEVIVAVLNNSAKRCFFSIEERMDFISRAIEAEGIGNAWVSSFDGLLAGYVGIVGGKTVLRGVRGASDYEYEFNMAELNKRLLPEFETVMLPARAQNVTISSTMVREIGCYGGELASLVPQVNLTKISERLRRG